MEEKETMIQIDNISKVYRLGEIGGTTLKETFQRLGAKIRRKEDPTKKIGAKNYNKGEKFKALDNINLTIRKGERVGIIGHNGAGKSTLLKLICRVTAPTTGEIGLNGRVTSMLEVGTGFHPELTGRENIYINGAILGMTKKEIDTVIEDIIDFSEVREFIDTPVKRYSSGMYVKLAFSVAAHLDSEIVIMDEVLAVGDVSFQNKCLEKMKHLSIDDNRTILYVSHNMKTIRDLCDRVIVLNNGVVVYDGAVEKGIKKYLNETAKENSPVFDITKSERSDLSLNYCNFYKVEYLNKKDVIFCRGEPVKAKVSWICKDSSPNVYLRITFRNSVGVAIGTCVSKESINCFKNKEYSASLEFDTSMLCEDEYYMTFSLVNINTSGSTVLLDFAKDCCFFIIQEMTDGHDVFTDWNVYWWGNIHFKLNKTEFFESNE